MTVMLTNVAIVTALLAFSVQSMAATSDSGKTCPEHYVGNSYGCYRFFTNDYVGKDTVATWTQGAEFCKSAGGHLAVLDTPGEVEALKRLMEAENITGAATHPEYPWVADYRTNWIGATRKDKNTFVWDGTNATVDFNWHHERGPSYNFERTHWNCLFLYVNPGHQDHATFAPHHCGDWLDTLCEINQKQ